MNALALTCCVTSLAFAQSDLGTIKGAITEPSGAVVANAQIQITNTATKAVYETTSSTVGEYTLGRLPAGSYELSVGEQRIRGYRAYQRKDISLGVSQTLRIDVRLELN